MQASERATSRCSQVATLGFAWPHSSSGGGDGGVRAPPLPQGSSGSQKQCYGQGSGAPTCSSPSPRRAPRARDLRGGQPQARRRLASPRGRLIRWLDRSDLDVRIAVGIARCGARPVDVRVPCATRNRSQISIPWNQPTDMFGIGHSILATRPPNHPTFYLSLSKSVLLFLISQAPRSKRRACGHTQSCLSKQAPA